jgi:hypothetical protein
LSRNVAPLGVSLLLSGHLRKGVRTLQALMDRCESDTTITVTPNCEVAISEEAPAVTAKIDAAIASLR